MRHAITRQQTSTSETLIYHVGDDAIPIPANTYFVQRLNHLLAQQEAVEAFRPFSNVATQYTWCMLPSYEVVSCPLSSRYPAVTKIAINANGHSLLVMALNCDSLDDPPTVLYNLRRMYDL